MKDLLNGICPYCREPVLPYDPSVTCPHCGITLHQACWEDNEGCTTFGCPATVTGLSAEGSRACPQCGTVNEPGAAQCKSCGRSLAAGTFAEPEPAPVLQPAEPEPAPVLQPAEPVPTPEPAPQPTWQQPQWQQPCQPQWQQPQWQQPRQPQWQQPQWQQPRQPQWQQPQWQQPRQLQWQQPQWQQPQAPQQPNPQGFPTYQGDPNKKP